MCINTRFCFSVYEKIKITKNNVGQSYCMLVTKLLGPGGTEHHALKLYKENWFLLT